MQFTTFALAALASIASVEAQTVKTIQVEVARNNSLTFKPSSIKADVGDAVQFHFLGGNHTVTQSSFDQPCQPISAGNASIQGVHSGFIPYAASAAMGQVPAWTIMVNNTNPIWLYCAQGKHCQAGMVMVINEPTNPARSLANYKSSAANVAQAGVPGGSAAGGSTGSTPASPSGSAAPAPGTAAGSMLSVPSTLSLLALVATYFVL